jgi:hypothetical protein
VNWCAIVFVERPSHGVLNDYTTSSDYITYSPHKDYCGTDFFTFRLQLGSLSSAAATVAITVDSEMPVNHSSQQVGRPAAGGRGGGRGGAVHSPLKTRDVEAGCEGNRGGRAKATEAEFDPTSML